MTVSFVTIHLLRSLKFYWWLKWGFHIICHRNHLYTYRLSKPGVVHHDASIPKSHPLPTRAGVSGDKFTTWELGKLGEAREASEKRGFMTQDILEGKRGGFMRQNILNDLCQHCSSFRGLRKLFVFLTLSKAKVN